MPNQVKKPSICLVVGTRPEAIKIAPLHRELALSETLRPVLLSTGQHREMLKQTLDVFGIVPDHDLQLMRASQTLPELTARAIQAISDYLLDARPDAVIVQGDTTSVLSAALAAFYAGIPVGHLEAGLRTGNMLSPWPEEMNRRLVSPLCRWNFVPTTNSLQNLLEERTPAHSCFITGNTVVDAILWGIDILKSRSESCPNTCRRLGIADEFQEKFMASAPGRFVLVTGHRRESFGEGIKSVCDALLQLVKLDADLGIVFPCHLNPNVQEPVSKLLGGNAQISLISPVDYLDMIWLMNRCVFIISDSGGIQEEAPTLGKPVLVTRENTERPEGVSAGTSKLVGTNPHVILAEATALLGNPEVLRQRCQIKNPYGDGHASKLIRQILESQLGTRG